MAVVGRVELVQPELVRTEVSLRSGDLTLVYDKRAAGCTQTHRGYSQLADDALAAAALLRTRPEVDPAKVGLRGISEGGWVVPMAAARSPELAFIVVVGADGIRAGPPHPVARAVVAAAAATVWTWYRTGPGRPRRSPQAVRAPGGHCGLPAMGRLPFSAAPLIMA